VSQRLRYSCKRPDRGSYLAQSRNNHRLLDPNHRTVKNPKTDRTVRGEATQRLVTAVALEFPRLHSVDSLLETDSFVRQLKKRGKLGSREKKVARRTLGRLMSKTRLIREALYIDLADDRVKLAGAGLVSASVNLSQLTDAWHKWSENNGPPENEPKQEMIVSEIVANTKKWVQDRMKEPVKKGEENLTNKCPLVLLDISIVHGSNEIDILMTVLYRESVQFMKYIREVIQRARYISHTHTMQLGTREGFPEIGRSAMPSIAEPEAETPEEPPVES
jgi:hypothetical protein